MKTSDDFVAAAEARGFDASFDEDANRVVATSEHGSLSFAFNTRPPTSGEHQFGTWVGAIEKTIALHGLSLDEGLALMRGERAA